MTQPDPSPIRDSGFRFLGNRNRQNQNRYGEYGRFWILE
jgi:hypothetical protein